MDIHPPHPIHSWRDFGVQLVTITAGILIALSFEGMREALHDRALVREARENIHREIADNLREVQKYASLYAFQDFLIQQQRRALDGLSTAIGILTISEDNDPRNAPRADIERFRDQVVSLRSILFIEEQLAAGVTARDKKALE